MQDQNHKTAFITGGSRGLGKDAALNIARKGHDVILSYVQNETAALATVEEIKQLGRRAAALQMDVKNIAAFDQLRQTIEATLSGWGKQGLDYLVNNAGVGGYTPIGQGQEAVFDNLLQIQFKGVYFLTEALLPLLNSGGGIVNISTGLTRFALPGYAAYAAMKGAVETYTKYLAKELGPKGIRANLVAPGAIDNDFNRAAFGNNPHIVDFIAQNTALGRVGRSEDIGSVVAFLCSEDARWVNAQRLEASGGMFL
ncbi:MAG: SDR family oxidoreductase [Bacteroidota bacterium]